MRRWHHSASRSIDRTNAGQSKTIACPEDGVAGEQDPGVSVVVGDGRLVMPGRGQAVEHPAAQIVVGDDSGWRSKPKNGHAAARFAPITSVSYWPRT